MMCPHAHRSFDAVLVLSSRIEKHDDGTYAPTTYAGSGMHGLSGGHMRVTAAAALFRHGRSRRFVFSGGRNQKTRRRFGVEAPSSSSVHAAAFIRMLDSVGKPEMLLEEVSVNTWTNLEHSLRIASDQEFRRIAILTSRYHIRRVGLMLTPERRRQLYHGEIYILSAEEIVMTLAPGEYDEEIAQAYRSEAYELRREWEVKGCIDLHRRRYDDREQIPEQPTVEDPTSHARLWETPPG